MGGRDHSVKCVVCGLQRGGLNDYKWHCDLRSAHGIAHRVIQDPVLGITLALGIGEGARLARISWSEGSCHVDAAALSLGRWVSSEENRALDQTPPLAVVCRATAIAVGAWIKAGVMGALEGLP